jgi:hypothetical protein
MNTSENINELSTALAKAQAKITNAAKDSVNPHLKSSYADLASIWNACREPLSENGLAVIQSPELVDGGVILTTRLMHSSGQWVQGNLKIPVNKNDAQGVGSAISYGRRYALAAMVGVTAGDDDGTAATKTAPNAREAVPNPARVSKLGNEPVTPQEAAQTTLGIPGVTKGTQDVSNQITPAQTQKLWAILTALEFKSTEESKAEAREFVTWLLLEQGQDVLPIQSVKDLTSRQASIVIDVLNHEDEGEKLLGKYFAKYEQAQHDAADATGET